MTNQLLGKDVGDKLTGFKGVAIGHCIYLTGCEQILVQPRTKDDGSWVESHWFDIDRIVVEAIQPAHPPLSAPKIDGSDKEAPKK